MTKMRAQFLTLIIFLALSGGLCWSVGTAHAQYQYYCHTPDGLSYWAYNPCAYEGYYNYDYDKGYPYNFNRNTFQGRPLNKQTERDHPRPDASCWLGRGIHDPEPHGCGY